MSQIITLPKTEPDTLSAFDIFGVLRINNRGLIINHIESIEVFPVGTIEVTMTSGQKHQFQEAEAEDFTKAAQHLKNVIIQNATAPQVVGVAPGTRVRH